MVIRYFHSLRSASLIASPPSMQAFLLLFVIPEGNLLLLLPLLAFSIN